MSHVFGFTFHLKATNQKNQPTSSHRSFETWPRALPNPLESIEETSWEDAGRVVFLMQKSHDVPPNMSPGRPSTLPSRPQGRLIHRHGFFGRLGESLRSVPGTVRSELRQAVLGRPSSARGFALRHRLQLELLVPVAAKRMLTFPGSFGRRFHLCCFIWETGYQKLRHA